MQIKNQESFRQTEPIVFFVTKTRIRHKNLCNLQFAKLRFFSALFSGKQPIAEKNTRAHEPTPQSAFLWFAGTTPDENAVIFAIAMFVGTLRCLSPDSRYFDPPPQVAIMGVQAVPMSYCQCGGSFGMPVLWPYAVLPALHSSLGTGWMGSAEEGVKQFLNSGAKKSTHKHTLLAHTP